MDNLGLVFTNGFFDMFSRVSLLERGEKESVPPTEEIKGETCRMGEV